MNNVTYLVFSNFIHTIIIFLFDILYGLFLLPENDILYTINYFKETLF